MIDHTGIIVSDLTRSKKWYEMGKSGFSSAILPSFAQ